MSRTPPKLVIDARPHGPTGPLAEARVDGRPVIEHLFDLVERVGDPAWVVPVHAREAEHDRLGRLLAARPSSRYRLALGPPPEDAVILRSDRIYDADRLRRAILKGNDPESAVVWRIDKPAALGAGSRQGESPAAAWAKVPSMAVARLLGPTGFRPARLPLASAALMLVGAASIAAGRGLVLHQLLPAAALAGSVILAAARVPLARLRGTDPSAGHWLDANLGELADSTLHAAVAWSAYHGSGRVGWLVVGMAYLIARSLDRLGGSTADRTSDGVGNPFSTLVDGAARADVRQSTWVVLAAIGMMPIGLAAYAAYFAVRALGRGLREGAADGP